MAITGLAHPDIGFSAFDCQRLRLAMDWPGTGPHSPDNAPRRMQVLIPPSRSILSRQRFAGKDTLDRRPGSALAHRLVGSPLPVIKCDDCPRQVVRRLYYYTETSRMGVLQVQKG